MGDGGVEKGDVGGYFLVGVGDFGFAGAGAQAEAFGLDEGEDGLGVARSEGGDEVLGVGWILAGVAGGEERCEEERAVGHEGPNVAGREVVTRFLGGCWRERTLRGDGL